MVKERRPAAGRKARSFAGCYDRRGTARHRACGNPLFDPNSAFGILNAPFSRRDRDHVAVTALEATAPIWNGYGLSIAACKLLCHVIPLLSIIRRLPTPSFIVPD